MGRNESKLIFLKFIVVFSVFVVIQSFSSYGQTEKQNCDSLISKDIRKGIIEKFNGWHILSDKDLIPDHRKIWEKTHQGECPGIVKGKFQDSKNVLYAVLIVTKESDKLFTKILVFRADKYRDIKIIYEENFEGNFPVI